jgi:hypothetical protein
MSGLIREVTPPPGSKASAEAMLAAGDKALTSLQPELAAQFYTRAIDTKPSDQELFAHLYERLGESLVAASEPEKAMVAFKTSLAIKPSSSVFSQLGQLSTGPEALEYLNNGIAHLQSSANPEDPATRSYTTSLHCSIAELFMTDLCDHPTAEASAEAAVTSALASALPTMPDALQAGANLRLSQNRGGEAVELILSAFGIMRAAVETMAMGGEGDVDEATLAAIEALPDFAFRTQTAKLMIECASGVEGVSDAERNELAEGAISVLGSLMSENDEVVETWFLLGCAFMAIEVRKYDASARAISCPCAFSARTLMIDIVIPGSGWFAVDADNVLQLFKLFSESTAAA